MEEKYIIEKGLDIWYTNPELSETSDSFFDAYLFSFSEVAHILQTHKSSFLRVERITADGNTVIENLLGAVEQSGAWKKGETWHDFYTGWKDFISEKCQDIIEEALSHSRIIEDIENQCLDEIIKRRSNE